MTERLRELLESVVFLPMRLRHAKQARPKYVARQEAMATTRDTLQKAKALGARGIAAVFDVGLYLLLFDQDLADFTELLVRARGDRRRRFLAKYEALLLYEVAEDLQHLLGGTFRRGLEEMAVPAELLKELNEASREVRRFWDAEQPFLQPIRHGLSAHREAESLEYVRQLEALEPLEVMKRAADLSGVLTRLISVFAKIGVYSSGPRAILSDMSASRTRPPATGGPAKRRGRKRS